MEFEVPTNNNQKLKKIEERIKENSELEGYLKSANVNAMNRLMYSDHGAVHIKIVSNAALKILRILTKRGITPNLIEDYELEKEDAEVLIVLASVLHDIGMSIHREDHDIISITISHHLLENLLGGIYTGKEKAIMISETLGAIFPHDGRAETLTKEAGIIAIADALDMAEGRARIPFESGKKIFTPSRQWR